jgi:hypothetical protein
MASNKKTPLKVTCTSADCKSNLHCFRATTEMKERNRTGCCRECGANLVDWKRVHRKDDSDVAHTFAALKNEFIRHHFWHKAIDQRALNHARRKGKKLLRLDVHKQIRQAIGAASPFRDGYQTSYEGNIIYYAQHATASCCRKCAECWHGIPLGRPLTDEEIDYLAKLAWMYIEERLPQLNEDREKVPPIRTKKQPRPKKRAGKRAEARSRDSADRRAETTRTSPPSREHPSETHQH